MAAIIPFPPPEPATAMSQCKQSHAGKRRRAQDSDATWAAWMVAAQAGDKDAYHALLVAIAPYLRAIANRHLGHSEDAEDAVQDILLVMHDIRHTYEPGRPFKPWLGTIATRRCVDALRRRARRIEHEVISDAPFDHLHDASPGPEDLTSRSQQARGVHAAIAKLSPGQRKAIRLLHLQDLSLNEAASQSRQSAGALKVACHRAVKSLKHILGKGEKRDDRH